MSDNIEAMAVANERMERLGAAIKWVRENTDENSNGVRETLIASLQADMNRAQDNFGASQGFEGIPDNSDDIFGRGVVGMAARIANNAEIMKALEGLEPEEASTEA